MAINLTKGQKIDLTKGNPGLKNIIAGLGWDTNKYDGGFDFDLDVSIFLIQSNGIVESERNVVFYNNRKDPSGSVEHLGDNRTGQGEGDDEQIQIKLDQVPANVEKISFTVSIHEADQRRQNFGQVERSYIHIINQDTNEELLRFDLGEDFSIETALIVAEIYRHGQEWKFNAIGSGLQGGLAALCEKYGL